MTDDRDPDQAGWAAPGAASGEPEPATWGTPTVPPAGAPPPPTGWGSPTDWGPPTASEPGMPAVPPPQAAPGAPRRRRGKGWLVTLVVVLATILAVTIAGTVLFVTRTLPPYNGASDFLADVAHHRDSAAAGRLCSLDNSGVDAIQRIRDRLGGSISTITPNPFGVDRSGSTAKVDFSVSYNNGTNTRSFSILVVDENGTWKPCP
jgi:hypothetical protein